MPDWFRKVSWTPEDQDDFWSHHRRARKSGKAQYLRIQAGHLVGTRKPSLREPALVLLNLLIAEFPEPAQLACAHSQRAEIHALDGRWNEAIADFRATLAQERAFPKVRSNAWLDFGWFAVQTERPELYDEVSEVLRERQVDALFPIDRFRMNSIRSVIAWHRGEVAEARLFAGNALREAERSHSGLRFHSELGLVSEAYRSMLDQLHRIQNG